MSSERIKAKIAALKAKTAAAGCTEAEALAAAEVAARLMRDHGLSEADLVMTEASTRDRTVSPTWRSIINEAAAYCTNTSCIRQIRSTGYSDITFVGREPGPEIAAYLSDVCVRAVQRELGTFKGSTFYRRRRSMRTRRQAAADFVDAMVERLCRRLLAAFASQANDELRDAASDALAQRFPGLVTAPVRDRSRTFDAAAIAGWQAAGGVALNRGVATPSALQLPFQE